MDKNENYIKCRNILNAIKNYLNIGEYKKFFDFIETQKEINLSKEEEKELNHHIESILKPNNNHNTNDIDKKKFLLLKLLIIQVF